MYRDRIFTPLMGVDMVSGCCLEKTDDTFQSHLPFVRLSSIPVGYQRTCGNVGCVNPAHIIGCVVVPCIADDVRGGLIGEEFPADWTTSAMSDYTWTSTSAERTFIAVIDNVFMMRSY